MTTAPWPGWLKTYTDTFVKYCSYHCLVASLIQNLVETGICKPMKWYSWSLGKAFSSIINICVFYVFSADSVPTCMTCNWVIMAFRGVLELMDLPKSFASFISYRLLTLYWDTLVADIPYMVWFYNIFPWVETCLSPQFNAALNLLSTVAVAAGLVCLSLCVLTFALSPGALTVNIPRLNLCVCLLVAHLLYLFIQHFLHLIQPHKVIN